MQRFAQFRGPEHVDLGHIDGGAVERPDALGSVDAEASQRAAPAAPAVQVAVVAVMNQPLWRRFELNAQVAGACAMVDQQTFAPS